MLVQVRNLLLRDGAGRRNLREEGQDGGARMAADHRHVYGLDGRTSELMHEFVGAHNVEGSDAADLAGVEALLLVELAHGRHHRVHRVHNETQDRIGAELRASLNDVLRNPSVDSQEVCASLARLAGKPSRNEHERAPCEALLELVDGLVILVDGVTLHLALLLQVREVSGHALSGHHGDSQIIDAELADMRVRGHEQAERLADAACATADADLEVARLATGNRRTGLALGQPPQGPTCNQPRESTLKARHGVNQATSVETREAAVEL
mmetsp:Transcript_118864/g.243040  ORF Transcript_118864/g.243040 Transcript_118864/m.243040 type:complete len:268 (+) Transcript_118864:545-1348(+)